MEFKRKVVHDFRKNLSVVKEFSVIRGSLVAGKNWIYEKSTSRSNGKVTSAESFRNNEDGLFMPRDMIFCLTVKKIVLSKVEKLGNFAFNLLRCLYKEWKIKQSPKRKIKRVRSVSQNFNYKLNKDYIKKRKTIICLKNNLTH